ncbi:sugar ABC transporter substrate-binding protein [Paenibacillus antibioticophila]|uniref:Sugar ABC transporter substrate-binding protein n=1 Tax=Paenibacillus antibioticophila TaxID=1274374 RepID=A0A919XWF0_9BACL|nr:extracellular solute-binding protein [Paenibacillus antibioticophila]GIO37713.1 sugar ABC transporter substrate-binding protein [Paenibacillus antibioticophila]
MRKNESRRALTRLFTIFMLGVAVITSGCRGSVREANSVPPGNDVTVDKYDPAVSITYLRPWGPDVKFLPGEDQDNNAHSRWAKEKLGIELKNLWISPSTNNSFETKLRLALAADAEMPDIIAYRGELNLVRELIESGKFLDGGELFDKYAGDAWKKAVNEDPTVWYPFMENDKRIGIPILDYAYNSDSVLWIREDWMEKFNFSAPKTLTDLEIIMEAFTNQDPDGNGIKDTYGLTIGFKNWINTWMSDGGWVFGAYGTMPNQWNLNEDGKLEYGSIAPGAKFALGKLRDWMEKGYIPEMAGWYDEAKAAEEFTAGRAGIVAGPHWMPSWPMEDMEKNVAGARLKAYPIPSGENGTAGRHGTSIANGVILINKNMEHPEAFFTYQNYLFDHYANPSVGNDFVIGLSEAEDAGSNRAAVKSGDMLVESATNEKYTVTFDGARIPSLNMASMVKLARGEEAATPFEQRVKSTYSHAVLEAAAIVMDQKHIAMKPMFNGAPTPTMEMHNDLLSKMEKDVYFQIIYGKAPLEAFDSYVEKWYANGGKQITAEVNAWYTSHSQ